MMHRMRAFYLIFRSLGIEKKNCSWMGGNGGDSREVCMCVWGGGSFWRNELAFADFSSVWRWLN